MPAFIYAGRPLLGVQGGAEASEHLPFSPAAIEAVSDRPDGFDLAKHVVHSLKSHIPGTSPGVVGRRLSRPFTW